MITLSCLRLVEPMHRRDERIITKSAIAEEVIQRDILPSVAFWGRPLSSLLYRIAQRARGMVHGAEREKPKSTASSARKLSSS